MSLHLPASQQTAPTFFIFTSAITNPAAPARIGRIAKGEAQIIRTNEAIDLSATARVLYVGDYNITSNKEASYQIIVSNTAPNGVQQGAGVDPFYPANNQTINWHAFTTDTNILAQESDNCEFIQYRDDLEMMTTNVYSGAAGGLKYVSGTYHTFGNNGSIAYQNSVNAGSNTALKNLATNGPVFITAAQLYVDLTGASDHLPVVADYTIPLPAPVIKQLQSCRDESRVQCRQLHHRRSLYGMDDDEPRASVDQLDGIGDQCVGQRQLHLYRHQCREPRRASKFLSSANKIAAQDKIFPQPPRAVKISWEPDPVPDCW